MEEKKTRSVLGLLRHVALRQLCAFAEEELLHLFFHDFLRLRVEGIQTVLIHDHLRVLDPERPGLFRDILEDAPAEFAPPRHSVKPFHLAPKLHAHHRTCPGLSRSGSRRLWWTAALVCHPQTP